MFGRAYRNVYSSWNELVIQYHASYSSSEIFELAKKKHYKCLHALTSAYNPRNPCQSQTTPPATDFLFFSSNTYDTSITFVVQIDAYDL